MASPQAAEAAEAAAPPSPPLLAAAQVVGLLLAGTTPADVTELPYVTVGLREDDGVVVQLEPRASADALTVRALELHSLEKVAQALLCYRAAAQLRRSDAPVDAGPVTRLSADLLRLLCPDGAADLRPPLQWLTAAAGPKGMELAVDPQACAVALMNRAAELRRKRPCQEADVRRCRNLAVAISGRTAQETAEKAVATAVSAETMAALAAVTSHEAHAAAEERCAELTQQLRRAESGFADRLAEAEARMGALCSEMKMKMEAEIEEVRKEAAAAVRQQAEESNGKLEQMLEQVRREAAETEKLKSELTSVRQQAEESKGKLQQVEQQLEQVRREAAETESKLSELTAVRQQTAAPTAAAAAAHEPADAAVSGGVEAERKLRTLEAVREVVTELVVRNAAPRISSQLMAEYAALQEHYLVQFEAVLSSPLYFMSQPLLLRGADGCGTDATVRMPPTASVLDLQAAAQQKGAPHPSLQLLLVRGRLLDVGGGMKLSSSAMIRTDGVPAAIEVRTLHPAARPPAVSAGWHHAAVLLQHDSFREWGQVKVKAESLPTEHVTAVYAGNGFTAAVVAGDVKVWGKGEQVDRIRSHLQQLSGREVVCCSAYRHSLAAVTTGGHLFLCGFIFTATAVPRDLQGRVAAVAVGYDFVVAVTEGGAVRRFGKNEQPSYVDLSGRTAVAVSAGYKHHAVVLDDGSVLCGGDNGEGQCDVPADLSDAVSCSCGLDFTVALRRDGTLSWWGQIPPHQKIDEAGSIAAVCAYGWYAAAVTTDGRLVADGNDVYRGFGLCDPPHVAVRGLTAAR